MKCLKVISYTLILMVCISRTKSLPVTRMRVCVQSSDPSRLQSQCVFCNNRMFISTVRQCTGYAYLPANLSVEEAFCMVRNCRRQMPGIRPEPFIGPNVQTSVDSVNNINTNDNDYNDSEPLYAENPTNSNQSSKRRPPASFTVGKPQRPPMRPFLFGKRSIQDTYRTQLSDGHKSLSTQNITYFPKSTQKFII